MSFWRGMPKGMLLRSNMSATNIVEPQGPLSLRSYMAETGIELDYPVPLSAFIEYGLWVQRTAVPDVDRRSVVALRRAPGGFTVSLSDGGSVSAERAVVAAGIAPFPRIPSGFEDLPAEFVSHTSSHRDLSEFAGKRVAVVGGGQSALESAALMRESGADVEVLVRAPRVIWLHAYSVKKMLGPFGPIAYAPTDVGPLWYSRLVATPDLFRRLPRNLQERIAYRSVRPACSHFVRVRLDGMKLSLGTRISSAELTGGELRLILSDGSQRLVDHLMFGTGYEIDVSRYPFLGEDVLKPVRRARGFPLLGRGLESSLPGLHFLGAPAAWSFGPTMRFVSGSWYAARTLSRVVQTSDVRRASRSRLPSGHRALAS
jgi:cation diffusion facilitator CzcD-associated flavoprotein CzcO